VDDSEAGAATSRVYVDDLLSEGVWKEVYGSLSRGDRRTVVRAAGDPGIAASPLVAVLAIGFGRRQNVRMAVALIILMAATVAVAVAVPGIRRPTLVFAFVGVPFGFYTYRQRYTKALAFNRKVLGNRRHINIDEDLLPSREKASQVRAQAIARLPRQAGMLVATLIVVVLVGYGMRLLV
jgi:hypothetical protein